MNNAHQALDVLRNKMSGDELRSLSAEQLKQFESICRHWAEMAKAAKSNTAA
jgi:hypothetical protein